MIDEVFGEGGILSAKFEGYAPRRGQVDMAHAVAKAIASRRHLVAEGPTGTGKSLAYLVPSLDWVTSKPEPGQALGARRVIVVTGNIALQEQLVGKDLPLLQELFPREFKFALAKGRNNYVCVDSLNKTLANPVGYDRDGQMARLLDWAQTTRTGDVSEFPETPAPVLWKHLSVVSDECKGTSCKYHKQCFAELAKKEINTSQVVVTNYHMFFAHLKVREKMQELKDAGAPVDVDIVLPPASVVVFDEAHKAADIARDFLGFSVTKGMIDWLVRGFNHELADQTRVLADRFFSDLLQHKRSKLYKARLKKGHGVDGAAFAAILERVGEAYKSFAGAAAWSPDEKAELEMRSRRAHTLSDQVMKAMAPESSPDEVFFIEENVPTGKGGARDLARASAMLKSKPIDVSGWLRTQLFEKFGTVVVTSATLSTGNGACAFSFVKKDLGLDESDEIVAESPFRWENQVLLCVPATMADAKDYEKFTPAAAEHVAEAVELAGGRTLGLFTSYKGLEAAHRACRDRNVPYTLLRQGTTPRTMLVDQFRKDVSSCLFGCESFWAGVDVPGESLSCVVIDRIPFPTPDDPIMDAIAERDSKFFFNYMIPRAIIQIKQGFGRLIRTTTDRGVVVILDRRITDTSYGRSFVNALPRGIAYSKRLEDVGRFLDAASTRA